MKAVFGSAAGKRCAHRWPQPDDQDREDSPHLPIVVVLPLDAVAAKDLHSVGVSLAVLHPHARHVSSQSKGLETEIRTVMLQCVIT